MCTLSVSNVIYHKFSIGAAFYTLNGKNVNVMLEIWLIDEYKLHGPSMSAVKVKIYGVLYNQFSSIAFDETSSY